MMFAKKYETQCRKNLVSHRDRINCNSHSPTVEVSGDKNARMHWSKYWELVVAVHRVDIKGWPERMAFANLSTVSKSIADLKDLAKRWKTGKTKWRRISDEEFQKMDDERSDKIDKGEIEGPRRRQTRSDKGLKRNRQHDNSARKRRKTGRSAEVISDSDRAGELQAGHTNVGNSGLRPPQASLHTEGEGGAGAISLGESVDARLQGANAANATSNSPDSEHAALHTFANYDPAMDCNFDDPGFLQSLSDSNEPLGPFAFNTSFPIPTSMAFDLPGPSTAFDISAPTASDGESLGMLDG